MRTFSCENDRTSQFTFFGGHLFRTLPWPPGKRLNCKVNVPDDKIEHGDWVIIIMLTFRFCASYHRQNKQNVTEQLLYFLLLNSAQMVVLIVSRMY